MEHDDVNKPQSSDFELTRAMMKLSYSVEPLDDVERRLIRAHLIETMSFLADYDPRRVSRIASAAYLSAPFHVPAENVGFVVGVYYGLAIEASLKKERDHGQR